MSYYFSKLKSHILFNQWFQSYTNTNTPYILSTESHTCSQETCSGKFIAALFNDKKKKKNWKLPNNQPKKKR